jgi:triphosphoribosyl-dephospho-CoA synthase
MSAALTPGELARIACILEATARKPGNVHRYRDFEDLTYLDFVLAAGAIAGPLDRARRIGVGPAILEAVGATRRVVRTNANLGMILLLAPLAAIPDGEAWRPGVERVLEALTVADARAAYAAIRLAEPGGLGAADAQDVRDEPTVTLRAAMRLAADRDLIARQYANGYMQVAMAHGVLRSELELGTAVEEAILITFVASLIAEPDTLIARKGGMDLAREASERARGACERGVARTLREALEPLDAWLTVDGHVRNPGATADLIAAALYIGLREGDLGLPLPTWSEPT